VTRPKTTRSNSTTLAPVQVSIRKHSEQEHPSRYRCVHEIFEAEVARRPDAVALKFGDQSLTYAQLNARANQLAHRLRELGVGPEVTVGVLIERSFEMVIGLLAVLKAGGAFVPLDASYPADRLQFILADTQAPVILAQKGEKVLRGLSSLNSSKTTLLSMDADFSTYSADNLETHGTAENLAYVMYTSGSTGQPKGVLITHRAIVRLVKEQNFMDMSEREVFLQFSPISFDASTLEMWAPLLNGGTLAILPPETQSLADIGSAIRVHGVTSMWLTAGLFNVIVEQSLEDLRPLRQLLIGGDVLSATHVRKALAALPKTRLINGYGPTENTTFTCCHTITRADAESTSIPIGRAISHTDVYVLDDQLQSVPTGVEGELCITGDGLARGYLHQPELTAEKFAPNPFSSDPAARMYKSGDRARMRPDGVVEFLGRRDQQVKISGHRIELGEIEAVLMQHPGVQSAALVAHDAHAKDDPSSHSEKKLVAYVVPGRQGCPVGVLRDFLREKLPAYMLPSAFVLLDALPLTRNGKLDRAALPIPEAAVKAQVAGKPAPTTAEVNTVERRITAIWQRVLGVKQIDPQANFFDAGGDSLQLLEVHAEMQKQFGTNLSVTDLFEHTTIQALAQKLTGSKQDSVSPQIRKAQERARQQRAAITAPARHHSK